MAIRPLVSWYPLHSTSLVFYLSVPLSKPTTGKNDPSWTWMNLLGKIMLSMSWNSRTERQERERKYERHIRSRRKWDSICIKVTEKEKKQRKLFSHSLAEWQCKLCCGSLLLHLDASQKCLWHNMIKSYCCCLFVLGYKTHPLFMWDIMDEYSKGFQKQKQRSNSSMSAWCFFVFFYLQELRLVLPQPQLDLW